MADPNAPPTNPYDDKWIDSQLQLIIPQITADVKGIFAGRGGDYGQERDILARRIEEARANLQNKAAEYAAQQENEAYKANLTTSEKIREEGVAQRIGDVNYQRWKDAMAEYYARSNPPGGKDTAPSVNPDGTSVSPVPGTFKDQFLGDNTDKSNINSYGFRTRPGQFPGTPSSPYTTDNFVPNTPSDRGYLTASSAFFNLPGGGVAPRTGSGWSDTPGSQNPPTDTGLVDSSGFMSSPTPFISPPSIAPSVSPDLSGGGFLDPSQIDPLVALKNKKKTAFQPNAYQ